MGRVGHVSSDIHRKTVGSGVRSARVSKKDATDKPARRRTGTRAAQRTSPTASAIPEPLVMEEFESVWEALGFPPEERANLEARSRLMRQIESVVKQSGWTQAEAAKRCGVSQPRINDLLRGKFSKFSLDALVRMGGALGRRVKVELEAA